MNTTLESGGSLYGVGTGNALDCSNALNDEACPGYAAAYLTQQCNLDSLYSTSCPLYWDAYDAQQCQEDPQYAPFCAGYTQEASVAYFVEDNFDYGYEEDYGYEDTYGYEDEYWVDDDPYYGMEFTDEEWYEIDLQEFGQEQIDEWYGTDVAFNEEGWIEWDSSPLDTWGELDMQMDIYDITIEDPYDIHHELEYIEEPIDVFDAEELVDLYEFDTILREELNYEEEENYIVFETIEELDEWFEEELEEISESDENQQVAENSEDGYTEEEIFEEEAVEEIYEELEEEYIAEAEEEVTPHEEEVEERIVEEEGSSISREMALNVVAGTMQTAMNSVSGTTSGSTISATGQNSISGNTSGAGNSSFSNATSVAASSSSSGGFSTSSSPSMSDQIASASVQTNTILSMSSDTGVVSNVSVVSSPMPTVDDSPQVAVAEVQVQDMQTQIDTAVADVSTPSEADQVASTIISRNIEVQQEQAVQEQEDTGQYGDESDLVALLGYLPWFNSYREAELPPQPTWYEPRTVYTDSYITDNISAFYGLAGTSLTKLGDMIDQQPDL